MLAALLMPAIQNAAQKAKAIKCLSNLRQIGISVQQYVADPENGSQFPPIYSTGATEAGTSSLQPMQCLSNYGITMALLTCPSDTALDPSFGSYIWSPILQGEQAESVHIYSRGGAFMVKKLSSLTICTDKGLPHTGKLNVLRADGHVETMP